MPAPITGGQSLPPLSNSPFVDQNGFLTPLGLNILQQIFSGAFGIGFAPQQLYTPIATAPTANNLNLTAAQLGSVLGQVTINLTATLGADATLTLPTVAALTSAMENAAVPVSDGKTFALSVMNNSSATHQWTVTTGGSGWTLSGTMTIAQNTQRNFFVTITSVANQTATIQSVGQFAIGSPP